MADAIERALGGGRATEINGKSYTLVPLTAKQLCHIESAALEAYKRLYLKTFVINADLLGGSKGDDLLQAQFEKVARWDMGDLPQKTVYDVSKVPLGEYKESANGKTGTEWVVNEKIAEWSSREYGMVPETQVQTKSLIVTSLDSGKITSDELAEWTGGRPFQARVRYDQWWVTATIEGMAAFLANSVLDSSGQVVSTDEIKEWSFVDIANASRIVETLSMADVGNS